MSTKSNKRSRAPPSTDTFLDNWLKKKKSAGDAAEVNLNNNNLKSSTEIMVLAHLPYLARIDISNNKLDIQKIVDYFKKVNPACKMVVNAKKAVNDNAVGVGTNQITYKKASTSSDDGCCQIV